MKQSEIRELSTAELQEKLGEVKAEYTKMKINHSVTPLENPMQLRKLRRDVARVATELTKRELQ
ncbi:MAG: 50S ribosomal protein L29 [Bacteroidota bacterium]